MNDLKFDILSGTTATLTQSELDRIMQPHVDSGQFTKEELAEIRKRESNRLKNEKERKKQEEEQRKKQSAPKKKEEEKSTKKVVLGNQETANEMLINADAERKGDSNIGQYDDTNIDYNKLYKNNNPLHNSLRHDSGTNFWQMEEGDAIGFLEEKYGPADFKFEKTKGFFEYRGKAQPEGKSTSRYSRDAVKIIAPDGSEEVIELDHAGFFQEGFGGWDGSAIENYNKLTNFIDTHLDEKGKNEILKDDETRGDLFEQERVNNLEPTEQEYSEQITEKGLLSTDIFNEKTDITFGPGGSREVTLEFGGYEKNIKQAREELIKENKEKSAVSNVSYTDPTIEEIKNRALQNLQNEEKTYLRKYKYDAYMNELEDFEDWDAEWVLDLAEKEGLTRAASLFGADSKKRVLSSKRSPELVAFKKKIREKMKEKYYQLKVAGNDEEATAVLDYRANELLLKNTVNKIQKTDAYKRFNQTSANIQDLNHTYARHENEVELENGKIIPLHVWEQHTKDQAELKPMFSRFDDVAKNVDSSVSVLKDNQFKWDLIKRNYDDFDRFQEVLGYGFGNLGMTAIYGVPKLLTFGASGGDDEIIRWKEVVSKNRQSFRKDVEWDRAFEDGNFGRFMAQSVTDQIPIYATLATGYMGLGILGGSVFGDKWAEMTMEERATGDFFSTTEKWFKSLGYAGAEVVLDYAITVPIMRNAKSMMFSGSGKALLDNTTKGFIRQNAGKALVFSPALEAISESATQATQNMIDGRPILEGMDHAAFLGLTMGMGISYTGFTGGVITSQFSDHKSYQQVRDNITEMQKIYNTNANLVTKIGLLEKRNLNTDQAFQELADNQNRIDKLLNQNDAIIDKVNNNIKNKIDPIAYRGFLENQERAEEIKVEAQKIQDSSLDQKTKDRRLKELLVQFNNAKAGSKFFKDPKSFGSGWAFVVNPTNKEQEENLERLKDLARTELQNEGKQEPDEKKVLERARNVWAKEQVRESNGSYKRTNLAKNYTSFETIDETTDAIDRQIQQEIDILTANNQNNEFDNQIRNLEQTKKDLIAAVKSGKIYGLTHVDIFGEAISLSVVESQARAERFETRTHEGGHQVFWNALQAAGSNEIFNPMAEQIIDWVVKNDKTMFKRMQLRTGNFTQPASEIVSVFLEEVADGKFNVRENKGFSNLWGLMSNDAITRTTGKDFEFDFAGETDVVNFLVGLGKKIKDGTFTKADERAIRKSELLRSFVTKESIEGVTDQFSQEASDNVQRIYNEQGTAGAFDIINEFKPITTRIARRYRNVPGYNEELLVSEIELGERGILDLISKYNPNSDVPLAAYINTYLPARSIEAANRILEEQFTEDVTERVDIAAEEIATDVVTRAPKKIVLSERLGVRSKVNNAVKEKLPSLDIKNLNFKTLQDQTPEITGKLFGISPKKLISKANITKKELQSAQMFINKNADVLIAMLPEGATTGGTATGVPNTLLKAFYTKTDRAKMAKTGTRAGLAVQVKNPNIDRKDFLEVFGIIDGKPIRTDRNTSARVLALASQTGKMMTNQAVRELLIKQGEALPALQFIADGKSLTMFSSEAESGFANLGRMDRPLSPEARVLFWDRLPVFADQAILSNSKESIEIALYQTYGNIPEIASKIPALSNSLYYAVQSVSKKIPKRATETIKSEKLVDLLLQKNQRAEKTIQEFTKSQVAVRSAFRNPKLAKNIIAADKLFATKYWNAKDPVGSIRFLFQMKGHSFTSPGRSQAYSGGVRQWTQEIFGTIETNEVDSKGKKIYKSRIDDKLQFTLNASGGINSKSITYNGKKLDVNITFAKNESENVLNEIGNTELQNERTQDELDAQNFLNKYAKFYSDLLKKRVISNVEIAMVQGALISHMTSVAARAASVRYVSTNAQDIFAKGGKLRYEHMQPRVGIVIKIFDAHINGDGVKDVSKFFENYNVAIIPTTMDDVISESGLGSSLYEGQTMSMPAWIRYYNELTKLNSKGRLIDLIDVKTGEILKASEAHAKGANIIKSNLQNSKRLNKAIQKARTPQYSQESKGITVLDFDDTLATTKSLVRFTAPDGTKGALNAGQYASRYQDLLEQGYKFDFTEFDKVVEAKLAPLFQKALKLQKKFGPKNMFILTARPPAAQTAIRDFLKANGLNIPLKNVAGLGNSTAEAKALWIADKVAEGYNDFYFADDALQNVQAVDNMLNQFDVKRKIQQAKTQFSKESINKDFNDILENVTGIESKKRFSAIKARKRGASKGKFRFFIPPSHEDFVGLLYNFIGKGKEGNAHRNFFEEALVKPLNRAYRELNTAKQSIANDYKSLNKQFVDVRKKLTKKTPDGDFTYQDAIRVYLFTKHGHKVPGLTKTDQEKLSELVMSDPSLQAYAETLNVISKQETYVNPTESWEGGDIRTDLDDATGRVGRAQYFAEFNENAEIIFSEENLNKIEATYGEDVVSAIKDILHRTKTGRNRPVGQNKLVNVFMNYLNGSVAATMFFNMRSAVLQQMSMVNFINFADNNVFAAAKAFANQKQYWTDWATIFNSDFMKQRRGGIKTDINGAELAASLRGAKNTPRALLAKLLELGFSLTQIGDNIAIASGGSTFYRNRINTYLKQGLSQKEAQEKAWIDFQILAEATQQSARPDMVSQQQASPLGKVILAFQNVTSQFNRLGKKAFLDIKNRRITPGNTTQFQSDVSNTSRIAYYFAIQNLIFYSLQSALFAAMFDDDEEDERWLKKKERVVNGSIDSVLRGTGVWGAVIATLKNMAIKWHEQREKGYNADESSVLMEMLNVSPPLGIKARKMVNAEKTLNYNKKVIDEMETFDIDNPMWSAITNYIEATTNVPLNRLYNKTQNVRQALNNQHSAFQRVLMFSGWSQWNLGIGDTEKIKEVKKKVKKGKKEEQDINQVEANKTKQAQEKKEGKKDIKCAAVSKSGNRCKTTIEPGSSYCTIHAKVKQSKSGKKVQCKKIKSNKKRCGMKTSAASGYCYYHD